MWRPTNISLTNDAGILQRAYRHPDRPSRSVPPACPGKLAVPNHIAALADDIGARVIERGNSISWTTARLIAEAKTYLWERNLRLPATVEQARTLDCEALRQCRVFCTGWKEWADATARDRCIRTIEMLMAVEREATVFMSRRAREPICGWSNCQRRSIYTTTQWREAA